MVQFSATAMVTPVDWLYSPLAALLARNHSAVRRSSICNVDLHQTSDFTRCSA